MTKVLLSLGAAAVALTAVPADARHYSNQVRCTKHRHGRCVAWRRLTRAQARRAAAYRVGYRFGPSYAYTDIGALESEVPGPRTVFLHRQVTQVRVVVDD